ncbi:MULTISPECIES: hypothetical protein [Pseudomonas]|uniref:Lipoprotein n=1 Tax=Pseudomonas viridiflava TaxID=33069 RepID=A0AA46ZUI4_PSEVI|nr:MULTISPECIES: hypothetical protein [Pseudomonas]KTC20529.1 hypothetical protein AO390_21535 [Pseudomonas marginalis ICMP 11289]MCF8981353.1 hypothetical protein [Pseudomonas syringae]MCQ9394611.1 hypothetical protein [Pseudomonas viridiflava]PCK90083.1 hypothetical protein PsyrCH409_20820 [Pseudomonas viridiflava]UZA70105.1 hypothetical protein EZZ81_18460 [Pseudomonas viridiflava]
MRMLVAAAFATLSLSALAAQPAPTLSGCNLVEQRALEGRTGGSITDRNEAHISTRASVLQADIGSLYRAGHLPQKQADKLYNQIEKIRSDSAGFVKTQGFLSAGERASYDRELDAIAGSICKT